MLKNVVSTIILLSILASPVLASIEWTETCSIVIHYNTTYQCGEYSFTNIEFTKGEKGYALFNGTIVPEYTILPQVMLSVKKNNEYIAENIILEPTSNEYADLNFNFKLDSSGFSPGNSIVWVIETYNPVATIKLYTRKIPIPLEVKITLDKLSYDVMIDKAIQVNVSIKNMGTAIVNNTVVNIFSNLKTTDSTSYTIYQLNKSGTEFRNIQYQSSYNIANTSIKVSTKLLDPDISGKYLYQNASIYIVYTNPSLNINVTKTLKNRIYISDDATVIITITNIGSIDITNVEVTDNLNNYLWSTTYPQKWYFSIIEAGKQQTIRYVVTPNNIGKFTIPEATIKYTYEGNVSETKSNTVIVDLIPIPGHTIRPSPQALIIPTPSITTTQIVSPTPVPTPELTPTPTPTLTPDNGLFDLPGFEIMLAIIAILISIVLIKYKQR